MLAEVRYVGLALGLYVCFVYWGYLQEKITSTKYKSANGEAISWDHAFALNLFMSLGGVIVSVIVEIFSRSPEQKNVPFMLFWKPAISSTLASPLGYAALKYISFPLVVLLKSCKPVPVILVGAIFFNRRYTWYKILGVLLLSSGIALFSSSKSGSVKATSSHASAGSSESFHLILGIVLVLLNLMLDGYTNNIQDEIFSAHKATSIELMKNVNIWTFIYIALYLAGGYAVSGPQSELHGAYHAFTSCAEVRWDIFVFCCCAAVGQVLIFRVMKEFGSLAWITISITRKLFTILVSVIMFGHSVKPIQWMGVGCVFLGMTLEVVMGYLSKKTKAGDGEAIEKTMEKKETKKTK
jgi:solute carrier family 35 (UDP-galactose transporter), member B1